MKLKPSVLYHGSVQQGIKVIEPRNVTTLKGGNPPAVFAAPSVVIASCFSFPWNGSWATISILNDIIVFIANNEKRLRDSDRPGSIYTVVAEDFSCDGTDMGHYEWIAYTPQKPLKEDRHSSALRAMEACGVDFKFMNEADFDRYMNLSFEARLMETFGSMVENKKPLWGAQGPEE